MRMPGCVDDGQVSRQVTAVYSSVIDVKASSGISPVGDDDSIIEHGMASIHSSFSTAPISS
jgi:hypothetical protein